MQPLLLASTSLYRRQLLARLGLPFEVIAPVGSESRLPDESPEKMVYRLAVAKADSVADAFPDHLIIGSDQVAVNNGEVLGKPGHFEAAARQLRLASGREVVFLTGLSLLNAKTGNALTEVVEFRVRFRELTELRIRRYLEQEQPYDCAGGFKSEGLGIILFERMIGDDPTALMGLPLMALTRMLEQFGVEIV